MASRRSILYSTCHLRHKSAVILGCVLEGCPCRRPSSSISIESSSRADQFLCEFDHWVICSYEKKGYFHGTSVQSEPWSALYISFILTLSPCVPTRVLVLPAPAPPFLLALLSQPDPTVRYSVLLSANFVALCYTSPRFLTNLQCAWTQYYLYQVLIEEISVLNSYALNQSDVAFPKVPTTPLYGTLWWNFWCIVRETLGSEKERRGYDLVE